MAWSLKSHVAIPGGANGNTSAGIDTTGADLIVIAVSYQANATSVTDNKGNTYTKEVDAGGSAGQPSQQIWACHNPTVGAGHTFTISGSSIIACGEVEAWSGSITGPVLDTTNSTLQAASVTTVQPGSVTPAAANALIVTGFADGATGGATINLGFTISDQTGFGAGTNYSGAMAYLVLATPAATNPTWSSNASAASQGAAIAVFKSTLANTTADFFFGA